MKLRIAVWTVAGALIVSLWSAYFMISHPAMHGSMLTLLYFTCPIALVRHHAMSFYVVLVTNAATYAIAGVFVETIRQRFKNHHLLAH